MAEAEPLTVGGAPLKDLLVGISRADQATPDLTPIFKSSIPNFVWYCRAHVDEDRRGCDYWIFRGNLHPLRVDVKIRDVDPIETMGTDDLAIEVWSAKESRAVGWCLDATKITDLVLWVWPTGRWFMVPFPQLVAACRSNIREWCQTHKRFTQTSKGASGHTYTSEHIYVPRKKVVAAMGSVFEGGRL